MKTSKNQYWAVINSLILLSFSIVAGAQKQANLEQYYYHNSVSNSVSFIGNYQTKKGWYGEARYNYEEDRTGAIFFGKTFSKSNAINSFYITPIAGYLFGKMHGLPVGLNAGLGSQKLFLTTQAEYVFSFDKNPPFFFAWTEGGINFSKSFFSGVALQQTCVRHEVPITEPGLFAGVNLGKFCIPIYYFYNIHGQPNLVASVCYQW